MEEKVFNRIEKKYLITKQDKAALLKSIKKYLEKDTYYKSEVLNLYFDTNNFDLVIQSIDQPVFKHKLRARSYSGYDRVFLEIKTKIRGRDTNPGYKRRVMITHNDFDQLVSGHFTTEALAAKSEETTHDRQIAREIDYLLSHHQLKPQVLISYNRESYKDNTGLRITFDENLRYRCKNLNLIKGKRDKIYFKDKKNIIMEIKTNGALPLWLVQILSKNHIYPQQFSKIGKIYAKIIKEQNV